MKNKFIALAIAFLLIVGTSQLASASPLLFVDRNVWELEFSDIYTVEFEGIAIPGSYSYISSGSVIEGGIFESNQYAMMVMDEASPDYTLGAGDALRAYNSPITVSSTLGSFIGFGVDLGNDYPWNSSMFNISLSTGEIFSTTVQSPSSTFFGIIAEAPISSVTLSSSTGNILMDNVSFANELAAVPEPATMFLFGTGLVGFAVRKRKA